MPPGRLAAPLVSIVLTLPPPPEPSMMRMTGRRKSCAISSAICGLALIEASAEPPRTVKSSPTTTTVRPSTLPRPKTQWAGVRFFSSPCSSYSPMPEIAPISWKLSASTILSMRSRTVSRPWSRCRLTFSTPPISRANASRRARSSSSGFQIIRLLRVDDLVDVGPNCKLLALQAAVEEIAVGAFEQSAYRRGQLDHWWRHLPVQALLVVHRSEQPDRDDDKCLVLRRPQRHGKAVDVRAPQAAGDDVAVLVVEAAVVLDPRPQHLCDIRDFPLHVDKQGLADVRGERRGIGVSGGRCRHGDTAAGHLVQAERICGTRIFEIDEMEAVGDDETDSSWQLIGDILQAQPNQIAQLETLHHRGAHGDRARSDTVFLVAWQIDQLTHPRQRVGQPRHRRSWQAAAVGDFEIAKPCLMALKAAQHVERA